jgi:hypothetical protein
VNEILFLPHRYPDSALKMRTSHRTFVTENMINNNEVLLTCMLNTKMFSFGHGIIAAKPSIKNVSRGERKASSVISSRRTVIELNSISSVIKRTVNCINAFTSLMPSTKKKYENSRT